MSSPSRTTRWATASVAVSLLSSLPAQFIGPATPLPYPLALTTPGVFGSRLFSRFR